MRTKDQNPSVPATRTAPWHDGGGIGGFAEQTPPAALIVFGVEIGPQIDPFRMGARLGG